MEPAGDDEFAVWLAYAPRTTATGIAELNAGLLALQATWDGNALTFTEIGRSVAFTAAASNSPARVTFDGSRVYAAFGCTGIASFDVSGGLLGLPALDTVWESDIAGSSILQVVPGAGNSVYAADLSGHVRVFDRDDLSLVPVHSERLRGQPTALAWTSGGTARFYVTDSRAGLHLVDFGDP